jgi:hypothetical protein
MCVKALTDCSFSPFELSTKSPSNAFSVVGGRMMQSISVGKAVFGEIFCDSARFFATEKLFS